MGREVVAYLEQYLDRKAGLFTEAEVDAIEAGEPLWMLRPRNEKPIKGQILAVRSRSDRSAKIAAEVLEVRAAGDWRTCDWLVHFIFHSRIERDRFPGKVGGYASSPSGALAVKDADHPRELAAVPEDWQDEFTRRGQERDEIREAILHPERIGDRDLLRKANKLRKLEKEARRVGVDITSELDEAITAVQTKIASTRRAA